MPTSDDEYGFDDLVLDDCALAVLDATERSLTASHTPTSRPRSSPEQQPSKRLKTDHGWVPLHGRQPQERSPPAKGPSRSRFSLEDTDLPEITITNGFYSGPGRFFLGSQQSEPPESPKPHHDSRESVDSAVSDIILSSTPTERQVHAPRRDIVAPPNNPKSRIVPPVQSSLAPRSSGARGISTNVVPSQGSPSVDHPNLALGSSRATLNMSLARTSSFNDAMRAALRNAMSGVDSPPLRRSSSATSLDSPQLLSAMPRMTNSRLKLPSHVQCRGQSLPPLQHLHPPRPPSMHEVTGSQLEIVSQAQMQGQPTPGDRNPSPIGDVCGIRDELESLKSQIEELKRHNTEQQRCLDQAVAEKRAKLGEVEILRTNLLKAVAAHSEETAKLRVAKENLAAAQVVAQKKQDAELERLRTQLIFKQHELEASRMAAPRAPASSQATVSSQIHRSDAPATPSRHLAAAQSTSPLQPVAAAPPPKTRPPLPGFVNTFAMPPSKKGKGKARTSLFERSQGTRERDWDPPPSSPLASPTRVSMRTKVDVRMEVDKDEVGGQAGVTTYPEVDFHMELVEDDRTSGPIASSSRFAKPFDWVGWIRQLVLAHAASPNAPTTMQLLLAQSLLYGDHSSAFSSACTSLMDAVAASSGGYGPVACTVANSLARIVDTLLLNTRLEPLIPTLNLLGVLVICLPSFATNLLKPTNGPSFLQTICTIIVNFLQPSNTNSKEPEKVQERVLFLGLANEVFCLLDAIIYSLPPECHSELVLIPQTPGMLATMLSKHQPISFLERSTRTLSYLSIRAGIFRSLLSFSEDTPESARNLVNLPQVDRMCALLMDSTRSGAEDDSIRASVLSTLISLAMAHEDALTILSESPFFIPSLVTLLAELSTTLWEEDGELTASAVLLSETVAMVARGVLLLHYVIFRTPRGPASLRGRLQAAPPRHFNGIGHQFVVALGRLSFAEPPDEVSASDRMLLEQLADPARDVMDLVVAGPESESVWSLFQEEDGKDEERDDDGQRGDRGRTFEDEEDIVIEADIDMLQDSSQLEYI